MKKTLSIIVLGILIFSTIGAIASPEFSHSNIKQINESISISEPVVEDENEYVSIQLNEGNSYLLEPNRPMLPFVSRVFILPFGTKINNVEVSYSGESEISLSKNVKPAIEPTPIGTSIKIEEDSEIYDHSEIFPQNKFTYRTGSGLSDGEHVLYLTVQCYPIWYSPSNNLLYYCDEIDIDVSYFGGNTFNSAMDEFDLAVISTSTYSSNIQQLIDHKNGHGVNTYFKDVEEIYDVYPGRDEQEKIKYYIKDAIETFGISYVLIVGSIYDVPIRMTKVGWGDMSNLPTDLYYADIYDSEGEFCSWDSNNNDIFGEYHWENGPIDDVDLYADVYIGRIPCMNSRELNVVIDKIITYENNAYGQSWFDRILLLGGDTFPHHGVIEGEYVTGLIAEEMDGFEAIKLWTSKKNYNPFTINYRTTLGAGFISYSGHGYIQGWGTSPPDVKKRIEYWAPYIYGMFNRNKLPIIFFDACLTATLDKKILGIFDYPAIAYNLVKKSHGGAVATIGATRVAFTHVDNHGVNGGAGYLNLHFFMNYEDGITLGEMLNGAQNDYLNFVYKDCITLEEFMIIGDPSLKTGGYP